MKGGARNKIGLIIVLIIIEILFVQVVSAGSGVVISSTGKLIMTPLGNPSISMTSYQKAISEKWFIFASGGVSLVSPPQTLEELYGYNLSSTACGVNGCGGSDGSLENQMQYNPLSQLPYKQPAPVPLNYSISSCGNCGDVTDPLAIPPLFTNYDENATACGINGCGGNRNYPNYEVNMNIPIQPHFNMSIKLPPAINPLINSETSTACGMCGGNPFIKSYTNPPL